jgi:hypothetical protein
VTSSKNLLVIFQVALSTVLLIGAVLLIESVARVRCVDLGFDRIMERVESIPGVSSAAIT